MTTDLRARQANFSRPHAVGASWDPAWLCRCFAPTDGRSGHRRHL